MSMRMLAALLGLSLGCCLLAANRAQAANAQSNLHIAITADLQASVSDQWSGLKQAIGKFDYFSATREHGSIPVEIKNGSFKLSFTTDSYLRSEGGLYYLVTPDFFYPDGPLDVHCTVEYPASLRFLDAKPAPDKSVSGRLEWNLADCKHRFILARFEPASATGQPTTGAPRLNQTLPGGEAAPDGSLVDSGDLPQLLPGERPANPDAVLTEMRNVLRVAALEHSTDPQFIRVMDKVLAKFYFLFDQSGQLKARRPKAAAPATTQASPKSSASHAASSSGDAPAAQDASGANSPRFRGIW